VSVRNLELLLHPRSVALFGASDAAGSLGAVVMRNLLRGGFQGPVLPVHPRHQTVAGLPAYRDVKSLPVVPDLAVICTPPAAVPGIVTALADAGTRAAVVLTGGFAREDDAGGRPLRTALDEAMGRRGFRLLGPDCLGVLVPGLGLNASFAHVDALPGALAFVSQSAGTCGAVLDWAREARVGFSCFASVGDGADVDVADLLDWFGADPGTRAILLILEHLEGLHAGAPRAARKFLSAARAAARNKPVLVLKAGRFPQSARAHAPPGAAIGADDVFDAALRRAGMLRVDTVQELFDAAETLLRAPRLRGDRTAIVSNGGGLAVLAADTLLARGGALAALAPATIARLDAVLPPVWSRANPVDLLGDATGERYERALAIVLEDPGVDVALVLHAPNAIVSGQDAARAVVRALEGFGARRAALPGVVTSWVGRAGARTARRILRDAGIASYETPDDALSACAHLLHFRRSQELLTETPPSQPEDGVAHGHAARAAIAPALAAGRERLTGAEARALLAAYGLPVADDGDARSGGPAGRPGAIECMAGLASDPVFGPVVRFGAAGAAAEGIADRAVALPPLNASLARELIARTRASRLLAAGRGRPPADLDAVARALVQVAQIAVDLPEVVALELDPVRADAGGVLVLGARIDVGRAEGAAGERLAIRPYPRELEETLALAGGTRVFVRPIRPEDEPAHQEFHGRLAPEDVRFRFFNLVRKLPHSQMARFTQVDYDREMAFVALSAGPESDGPPAETLGVVRAITDPDNERAEFAIIVRSDQKGRGLGHALLAKMIRYCRARGTREVVGQVLPDNRPMLELAHALGFQSRFLPEDGAVEVRLALRE
jgi:acyl-CoA synthetase (NDP forming)/GNAT superfamily N-acetyltransferase